MPNTTPATDSGEVVRYILDKANSADANVYVAASITKGLKSLEPTDIEELKNAGAIALTDDGRPVENTRLLSDAMKKAPLYGMHVVAHCEDLYLADGGKINRISQGHHKARHIRISNSQRLTRTDLLNKQRNYRAA